MKAIRVLILASVFGLAAACTSSATPTPTATQPPPDQPTEIANQAEFSNLALGQPVKASEALPNFPPQNAVDGNTQLDQSNWWGSGQDAPQWIEIDLGQPSTVHSIRLLTSQDPAGFTRHEIFGCIGNGLLELLHTFAGQTKEAQWLEIIPPQPWTGLTCLRVETPESPSWISWREIEVIGAIEDEEEVVRTPISPPQIPTVIFHNGDVLSMEAGLPTYEAIAIHGDTILALGSNADILDLGGPGTELIDLDGHTLMPGFVDAHTHILNDAEGYLGLNLIEAQDLAFQNGITTIGDMFVTEDFLHQMEALEAAGDLRLRTSLYLIYTDNCGGLQGDWYTAYPRTDGFGERLRIGGVKIFTDGGSCGNPAVSEEFTPGVGLGDLFLSDAELNTALVNLHDQGYQVVMHAVGDRAIEQAQNAIELALDGDPNTPRHRIDHNSIIRPDMIGRYNEIGIVAAIFGHHSVCGLTPRSPFYEASEWPWRDLLDANPGLHVAWHGDDPWVGPISPILELSNMVTRHEVADDGSLCTPPAWLAAQAITVEEALPMMTTGSAYALFREDELGSLEPGKLADLIVLSGNPLTIDPLDLHTLDVWMTMVGGTTEFCASGQEAYCP